MFIIISKKLPFLLILVATLCGCVTDSKWLTKTPFFRARSDYIPGVMIPKERVELIREKGNKGKNLPESEKIALLEQLTEEYQKSSDPNIREESIKSIALLNLERGFQVVKTATSDPVPFVRMTACDALTRWKNAETAHTFRHILANDDDQYVRIRAAKNLEAFTNDQETIEALGKALNDKAPAIRYAAMQSLKKVTGQDYGNDVLRWREYVAGDAPSPAKKRSISEQLHLNQLPMFN